MSSLLRKILQDQRDLLLFRPFKPAIQEHWPAYLAFGLLVTWLAGLGRYWDHPKAEWWQYAGLGSVAYVFVLAAFIWLIVAPLRPRNWSFPGVLIFVTLTSLPALLYAIPVEKFMSLGNAQTANVIFLAVVASWRVALLIVFLKRSAGLTNTGVMVASLLPLTIIVTALVALQPGEGRVRDHGRQPAADAERRRLFHPDADFGYLGGTQPDHGDHLLGAGVPGLV